MRFEVLSEEGVLVFRPLETRLHAGYTTELKGEFTRLAHATEPKPVIVDLSTVEWLDSSVLSALLLLRRMLEGQGRSMAVMGLNPAVESVFRLTKIDTVMPIMSTMEEALAYFTQQSQLMAKKAEEEFEEEEALEEDWDEEDLEDFEDWDEDEEWDDEEWEEEDEDWDDEDWEEESEEEDED